MRITMRMNMRITMRMNMRITMRMNMRITMRMNMRIWWGWSEYGKDILVLSGSPNPSQAIWLHLSWWWCSFKKLSFHRSGSAEISIILEWNKQKASVFCKVGPAYVSGQKLSQGWTLFILCNCETQPLTDQKLSSPIHLSFVRIGNISTYLHYMMF